MADPVSAPIKYCSWIEQAYSSKFKTMSTSNSIKIILEVDVVSLIAEVVAVISSFPVVLSVLFSNGTLELGDIVGVIVILGDPRVFIVLPEDFIIFLVEV